MARNTASNAPPQRTGQGRARRVRLASALARGEAAGALVMRGSPFHAVLKPLLPPRRSVLFSLPQGPDAATKRPAQLFVGVRKVVGSFLFFALRPSCTST